MAAREIMYVGRKPTKWDNKNEVPRRIWRGLGDVIGMSQLEAEKCAEHPDIWLDVTDWDEAKRKEYIAAVQERRRAEERERRQGEPLALTVASDDELLAELQRRQALRGEVQLNEHVNGQTSVPRSDSIGREGEHKERPENTEDLAAEIIAAVVKLDKETGYNKEGSPYLAKVIENLGYKITKAELDAVMKAAGGE